MTTNTFKYAVIAFITIAMITSCKKEELEIKGCTDTTCSNYNEEATEDDGSCVCETSSTKEEPLKEMSASNIVADTGRADLFTYYSLSENKIIDLADSATTKWDLAFAGTTILTNSGVSGPGKGGVVIDNGIFDELETAPSSGYATDGTNSLAIPTGSDNGWYHYTSSNSPEHSILPIAGKILIVRTANGNYAKVEILSYYKGIPNTTTAEFADSNTRPDGRYYNFRFIYQPDGSTNLK